MKPLGELVEVDLATDEKAANFRAKLLGLIYEDVLEAWFRESGYDVLGRDVRRGRLDGEKFAVDFLLVKAGRLFAVEAKCWPSYVEGKLKRLSLRTIERLGRGLRKAALKIRRFLDPEFCDHYMVDGKRLDGKILAWWDVDESDVEEVKAMFNLAEIVSIKRILEKSPRAVVATVQQYRRWSDELFDALLRLSAT